jgi:hypothetical protein
MEGHLRTVSWDGPASGRKARGRKCLARLYLGKIRWGVIAGGDHPREGMPPVGNTLWCPSHTEGYEEIFEQEMPEVPLPYP